MRALIDQGSQVSGDYCKGKIFGVGLKENNAKGLINITLQSTYSEFTLNTNIIIMNNLIKSLPNISFKKPSWEHINGLQLADPKFNISRLVDLLLGAEVYSKIMLGRILRGKEDQPIAQQSHFGWLLCGTMTPHYNCNVILRNTDDLLKFWEHEDINQKIEMSSEDHECLQYFRETTRRLENGRYKVRLPFKPEMKEKLGETKPQALVQFRNPERKLKKNHELKTDYTKFLDEYFNLNHMILSPRNQPPECYLPHHAVTRESTTTKLRVVYNASAKSSTGLSLNNILYRGPNIQELILKWRHYQFVLTADVEKMFRQVRVHKDDQKYQKIVWRDSLDQPIKEYQLVTITYGTKPAGWLAMCLQQLADDEKHNFPEAAKDLK